MEQTISENINYLSALTKGIIKHCNEWNYDYIDKLLFNKTEEGFIKAFCKITCTYYFKYENETYGTAFNKQLKIVQIYKCGKDHERILGEYPIFSVVDEIITEMEQV